MSNHIYSNRIKLYISIILFLICILFYSGCANINSEPVYLWIVTEETTQDGMNHQINLAVDAFCTENENVTIKLDILPTEETERAEYLDELYALMESGNGPDIFLLPTYNVLTLDHPQKYTYTKITPLFPDVNLAMRQGYFMDIQKYYNKDKALDKDALNNTVMDAGLVGNARYTLPLRFNAPVMYVDETSLAQYNIDITVLEAGIDAWMEYMLQTGDPLLACSAEYYSLNAFSNIIDYDQSKIILDSSVVTEYMHNLQQVVSLFGTEIAHRSRADINSYIADMQSYYPAQLGTLENALDFAAIAQARGTSLTMYPVPTVEGDWIAGIRYFAAVGANCAYPETAYNFIRMFLLEEYQWEQNRLLPATEQYSGLLERGWPVRTTGSVEPLWANYKMQSNINWGNFEDTEIRFNTITSMELTDYDIPILSEEFDAARYPIIISPTFDTLTGYLNDFYQENAATNVNLDELIAILYDSLSKVIH